jgi:hypothetical protein
MDARAETDATASVALADAGVGETGAAVGSEQGALCIRRERDLPINEAGGLAPKPMPPHLYAFQIDDGQPVDVRPDAGTLVRGLDLAQGHRIVLLRKGRHVATATVQLEPRELCIGLSNYSGSFTVYRDWGWKRCGCAPPLP